VNAGTVSLSTDTVDGNQAAGGSSIGTTGLAYGGGIFVSGGTVNLSSDTLDSNVAGTTPGYGTGGALYVAGGTVTVTQDTFSGNTPNNIYGPYIDGGGNHGL
jgi:hypothetical protein